MTSLAMCSGSQRKGKISESQAVLGGDRKCESSPPHHLRSVQPPMLDGNLVFKKLICSDGGGIIENLDGLLDE